MGPAAESEGGEPKLRSPIASLAANTTVQIIGSSLRIYVHRVASYDRGGGMWRGRRIDERDSVNTEHSVRFDNYT
jgi:hypothetical protein